MDIKMKADGDSFWNQKLSNDDELFFDNVSESNHKPSITETDAVKNFSIRFLYRIDKN